jgi:DeoR/GlpR family transcriptional regulator of sugar metabolism
MKLSPAERERKILDRITQTGTASVQELAEALSVSTMTIHRDLNRLEAMGHIRKRHGGALLARDEAAGSACAMCGKSTLGRKVFILSLANGENKTACCAHCGLMLMAVTKNVWQTLTMDFLHGHMISAQQAVYLIGCDLNVCCVPTVLTFGSQTEAERFRLGFGGRLASMEEAAQSLLGAHQRE